MTDSEGLPPCPLTVEVENLRRERTAAQRRAELANMRFRRLCGALAFANTLEEAQQMASVALTRYENGDPTPMPTRVAEPRVANDEAGAFPAVRDARPVVEAALALVDILVNCYERPGHVPDWDRVLNGDKVLNACRDLSSKIEQFERGAQRGDGPWKTRSGR